MALNAMTLKRIKPADKPIKYYDGEGLYLLVRPITKKSKGGMYWRFKYRFNGKEKVLALGVYTEQGVSLADARTARKKASDLLKNGIDPSQQRKLEKTADNEAKKNTFRAVAEEWVAFNKGELGGEINWADSYTRVVELRLNNDVYPWLGDMPINDIKPADLLAVINRIIERGAIETARRVQSFTGQVFRFAVRTLRADRDISADIRGGIPKNKNARHMPAIIEPEPFGQLIANCREYSGHIVIITALNILPYVFTRPSELRNMEWQELDFDKALWIIPKAKMRKRKGKDAEDHVVPLSRQVITRIKYLEPLTGKNKYVFSGIKSNVEPFSNNALRVALRNMGYTNDQVVPHGFRTSARTMLEEKLGYRDDILEQQLSHKVLSPNGRAYNRTKFLPERVEMMQTWADFIDHLACGNTAKEFKKLKDGKCND